ncbi:MULTISPECIES: hypothetical protein [unclassified Pseudomonas]|uniref:hypothetical protein n=1 Tax=unclassified Pseudomonas TaxID=196821 RepID=UPI0035584971
MAFGFVIERSGLLLHLLQPGTSGRPRDALFFLDRVRFSIARVMGCMLVILAISKGDQDAQTC